MELREELSNAELSDFVPDAVGNRITEESLLQRPCGAELRLPK
jgi:hypothetical protein